VRKKSLYRLVLSVEMLGKAASVELDPSEVERISNSRRIASSIDRTAPSTAQQLRTSFPA
jgi:hypothetical protein